MPNVVSAAIVLMLAVAPSYADDQSRGDQKGPDAHQPQEINPYDALADSLTDDKMQSTINDNECTNSSTVVFEKFMSNLSAFRGTWLSDDYSLDFYAHHGRQVLTIIVMKRLAAASTVRAYSAHPKTDCHFSVSVQYDDKYGHSHTFKALTWTFTNELASKLNWDKFDEKKFNEIAADWNFTKETDEWNADEPPLSDDGKRYPLHHDDEAPCSEFLFNANAIFFRATTFCHKDYLDSRAGYTALAGSKICFHQLDEKTAEQGAKGAMQRFDDVMKSRGRRFACATAELIAKQIDAGKR